MNQIFKGMVIWVSLWFISGCANSCTAHYWKGPFENKFWDVSFGIIMTPFLLTSDMVTFGGMCSPSATEEAKNSSPKQRDEIRAGESEEQKSPESTESPSPIMSAMTGIAAGLAASQNKTPIYNNPMGNPAFPTMPMPPSETSSGSSKTPVNPPPLYPKMPDNSVASRSARSAQSVQSPQGQIAVQQAPAQIYATQMQPSKRNSDASDKLVSKNQTSVQLPERLPQVTLENFTISQPRITGSSCGDNSGQQFGNALMGHTGQVRWWAQDASFTITNPASKTINVDITFNVDNANHNRSYLIPAHNYRSFTESFNTKCSVWTPKTDDVRFLWQVNKVSFFE